MGAGPSFVSDFLRTNSPGRNGDALLMPKKRKQFLGQKSSMKGTSRKKVPARSVCQKHKSGIQEIKLRHRINPCAHSRLYGFLMKKIWGRLLQNKEKNGINRLMVQSVNPCTGYSATRTGLLGAVSTWRPAAFYVSSSHFKPNCRKMQEGIKWIPFRIGAVKNRVTGSFIQMDKERNCFPQYFLNPSAFV